MKVYKLDRFSRNKYESVMHKRTLKENGVKLVSAMENIPDTPEGIILESLLEGMNQYYSAELSQKVKRGLKESWIKGNFTGGQVPFGYDGKDKKYVVNEAEASIVREIFTKSAAGYTAKVIAEELRARGVRNKKDNPFTASFVYKVLLNRKYTGKVVYGGQEYDNIIPPIIDEGVWRSVQLNHESNRHAPGRKKDIYDFILSGKLICGDCKRPMVGESGTSHTGAVHYYYSCLSRRRNKCPCRQKSVNKQYLEDAVIQTTWAMLSDKDTIHTIAEWLYKLHEAENKNNPTLKMLEKEHSKALKASDNLIRALEEGIITEQTKNRLKELEAKIAALEFDIEQEKQRSYTFLSIEMLETFLQNIIDGREDNIETRKLIVKTSIREVILYENEIVITYNFCDTYGKHEITPERVKEIEKQSKRAAFPLIMSSYKFTSAAPRGTAFEHTVPLSFFERYCGNLYRNPSRQTHNPAHPYNWRLTKRLLFYNKRFSV